MSSAPIFYHAVVNWTTNVLLAVTLVGQAGALGATATRRPARAAPRGPAPKGGGAGMPRDPLLFPFRLGYPHGLPGPVAIAGGLVFLLDVRPALRDAVDGRGSW